MIICLIKFCHFKISGTTSSSTMMSTTTTTTSSTTTTTTMTVSPTPGAAGKISQTIIILIY